MTEMSKIPTAGALAFAAEHLGVSPSELSAQPVSGGYSLNRRAVVSAGSSHVFVKEVDETLVEGDGERERDWLAKDYAVAAALRGKGVAVAADWGVLSSDRSTLLLPALRGDDGWLWELPTDQADQVRYIEAVLRLEEELEAVSFTEQEVATLSLRPYFREKIAEDETLPVLNGAADLDELRRRCDKLLRGKHSDRVAWSLHHMVVFLGDNAMQQAVRVLARQLRAQPDEVFGHCDLRSDNLAYHPVDGQVQLVDWNWASYTPRGFGSTEFLIDCEKQGVDTSPWGTRYNWPLVACLVGLFLRSSLQPNLGDTSRLREHQLIGASIAVMLLKANHHL